MTTPTLSLKTLYRFRWLIPYGFGCPFAWSAIDLDLVEVGRWPVFNGRVEQIVVQGHHAYGIVGEGEPSLVIFDVGDPEEPVQVGNFQGARAIISVSGDEVCVAVENSLLVVDVGDPARTREVGRYEAEFRIEAGVRAGNYVYLAAGAGRRRRDRLRGVQGRWPSRVPRHRYEGRDRPAVARHVLGRRCLGWDGRLRRARLSPLLFLHW